MEKIFSDYIRADGITFKHANGESAQKGKEFHTYHEIILFLGGCAELITEDIRLTLSEKTFIIIPKETYHQMIIHGEQENYYRCIINFQDIPPVSDIIKKVLVTEADEHIMYLFKTLIDNVNGADAKELLRSVLVLLINETKHKENAVKTEKEQHISVQNAINYINSNLENRITIADISKNCHISPSSLSHLFKKEMKIPLHRFIIKKRLINAYHKITSGEDATTTAIECGFNDYSGFYKQYKNMFGFPPSDFKRGNK